MFSVVCRLTEYGVLVVVDRSTVQPAIFWVSNFLYIKNNRILRMLLLVLLLAAPHCTGTAVSEPYPDSHVQCSDSWNANNWPTFHLLNNVTKRANGELDMEV